MFIISPHTRSHCRRLIRAVLLPVAVVLCGAAPAHAVLATVTTTADSGPGSLRAAITATNTSGGTIKFNIPLALASEIDNGRPGGDAQRDVFRILPASPLPALTQATIIDGTSQNAVTGDSNVGGPEIAIQGSAAGAGPNGLEILAASCRVKSLILNGWSGAALVLGTGASGVRVTGCYIGTNYKGTGAVANGTGVLIRGGATNNVIGGTVPDTSNVISGNSTRGIAISGVGTTGNDVQGNFIGTNHDGTAGVGNLTGVLLSNGAVNNTIGPNVTGSTARNIISGNQGDGVLVSAPDNKVLGNYIGTDALGTKRLPNGDGVTIDAGGSNTVIGGDASTKRNVISGNTGDGIIIRNSTSGNKVQSNYVGIKSSGAGRLPNLGSGVVIDNSANNAIGDIGARNIISGNSQNGIHIRGALASGNTVRSNYIGTRASGNLAVGNLASGVRIDDSAHDNTIGAEGAARNIISGNDTGVIITGGATNNVVRSNYIGTNRDGKIALGNVGYGVYIITASSNTIGGSVIGARNTISANGSHGVVIGGNSATGNKVQGNHIGTDVTGAADLGNALAGVFISLNAFDNVVGGELSGAGNRIAFNALGVHVETGTGNTIRRNIVYSNDGLGIDLGPAGVTPNDIGPPHDADIGANNLQNSPQLSSATTDGSSVKIMGRLRSTASTSFIIEFFANPICDPSGSGEGKIYIGTKTVSTDADGEAFYDFTFADAVPPGQVITATATNPAGSTSEYSVCESVIDNSTTVASAGHVVNELG